MEGNTPANDSAPNLPEQEAMTQDEFQHVHNRLAPMVWSLAFDLCRENPGPARLNAVLNSLLTLTCGWVVAVTPEDMGVDSEHFDVLVGKFKENMVSMFEDHEVIREDVSQMGNFQGKQLVLRHQNEALANAVQQLIVMLSQAGPEDSVQ